jgi:ABC-type proline/glycine betaine transport system substrate-binding protein
VLVLKTKSCLSLLLASKLLLEDYSKETTIGKMDYSTLYTSTQNEPMDNTMDYNYITTEKFIQDNNKKYQEYFTR